MHRYCTCLFAWKASVQLTWNAMGDERQKLKPVLPALRWAWVSDCQFHLLLYLPPLFFSFFLLFYPESHVCLLECKLCLCGPEALKVARSPLPLTVDELLLARWWTVKLSQHLFPGHAQVLLIGWWETLTKLLRHAGRINQQSVQCLVQSVRKVTFLKGPCDLLHPSSTCCEVDGGKQSGGRGDESRGRRGNLTGLGVDTMEDVEEDSMDRKMNKQSDGKKKIK